MDRMTKKQLTIRRGLYPTFWYWQTVCWETKGRLRTDECVWSVRHEEKKIRGYVRKIPQLYKTSLKCLKIKLICINLPQMYKNWPHLYKQGTDDTGQIHKRNCWQLTKTHRANLQCKNNEPQMDKQELSSMKLPVGWTSVYFGFITSPQYHIATRYRLWL